METIPHTCSKRKSQISYCRYPANKKQFYEINVYELRTGSSKSIITIIIMVNKGCFVRTGSPVAAAFPANATFPRVGGDTRGGGGGVIQSDASTSRRLFKARAAGSGYCAAASSVTCYRLNRLHISFIQPLPQATTGTLPTLWSR